MYDALPGIRFASLGSSVVLLSIEYSFYGLLLQCLKLDVTCRFVLLSLYFGGSFTH